MQENNVPECNQSEYPCNCRSASSCCGVGLLNSNPKTTFLMGLFLGIGVSAVIALAVILGMMWTGKSFAAIEKPTAVVDPANPTINEPEPTPAKPVAAVTDKDHIRGNKNAKVTLIEYSDFQCPFCSRHVPTIEKALKDFPKDVRVVFRHFPLSSIHPFAQKAAEASECAAKLAGNDGFWKMHDKLFAKATEGDLTPEVLATIAKEIKLDAAKFKSCLDSGEMKTVVDAQFASGNDSGVEGTPATFINGKLVVGAIPYETFKQDLKTAGAKE